jgi:hypothetical protein
VQSTRAQDSNQQPELEPLSTVWARLETDPREDCHRCWQGLARSNVSVTNNGTACPIIDRHLSRDPFDGDLMILAASNFWSL